MRAQWACPDLGRKKPLGLFNPIPGSTEQFDDCPAFYLRMPGHGLPAPHLIDDHTHPAQLIGQWAFEVESGSRNAETLSPKVLDLVHLHLRERRARDAFERDKKKGGA